MTSQTHISRDDSKPKILNLMASARALKEKGIDISMNKPKLLTYQMAQDADLIVTMGCNDQGICPGPFFKPTVDWKLDDPKGKPIEKVRGIRDEIERRVQNLIAEQTQG